jgi:hypothetical protein
MSIELQKLYEKREKLTKEYNEAIANGTPWYDDFMLDFEARLFALDNEIIAIEIMDI